MSMLHGALRLGRRMTNVRMTETVTIGRYKDGTDPATGDPTRTLVGTATYTGPGQIKYPTLTVSDSLAASQQVAAQSPMLKIPTGSPVPSRGEEVHVTASTADGSLVGRRYKVDGHPQAGQTTSLRLPLTDLS